MNQNIVSEIRFYSSFTNMDIEIYHISSYTSTIHLRGRPF